MIRWTSDMLLQATVLSLVFDKLFLASEHILWYSADNSVVVCITASRSLYMHVLHQWFQMRKSELLSAAHNY